jgi:hypothetical protein
MGNNNKDPMMQPIPLAQPQGPQPPQNAQTMPGQPFGQPTGGVPGYAQPGQPKPKKPIWKQWWFWVIIVVVVVLDIAIIGGAGNSQGGGSAVDSSSAQSVAPKSTQKATPKKDAKLTGITASYSGSIKDGEQVTDKTSGITVTAKYDDGTTKNVTGWKIQNPGAVNINAPTEFTIEYEGQTAKVSIQAQPPVEYQNALNKAKSYSDMMHMSKQGIYDQLTSEYGEKFPAEAAQYAVDHLQADYNANALAKAKSYQEMMSMSSAAIYDQLVSSAGEKFTPEEAQYAIDNLNK